MYTSPIEVVNDVTRNFNIEFEGAVVRAVRSVGIHVDKDELVKALDYDRKQYADGYSDGYSEGYKDGSNYAECGCEGCAFIDVEEWDMPCAKCKRGCRDYYRRSVHDEKKGQK